jgi:hypothetical protein
MRQLLIVLLAALAFALPPALARAQYVMDSMALIAQLQIGDLGGAVAGVNDANRVYVARLSELQGTRINGARLDRVIAMRARVIRYFQAAIRGAREARKALEVHGQTLEQVVFATFTNDRTATLYVDDR